MCKTILTKSFNDQTYKLALILSLCAFLAIGCSRGNNPANGNSVSNGNSAVNGNTNNSKPTNANTTAPSSDSSKIEQKAKSIVGKWETTTALDDKITFDFAEPKKEGDAYAGTYVFEVNGSKDPSAKYLVSGDKMIKFFNEEGKEYPLIKVSISDDGKSLSYEDQKGGTTKLTKVGSETSKTTESADGDKGDCTLKEDNVDFFNEATEKTVKLKKGTPIKYIMFGNQGLAVVQAQLDGKWVRGEIQDHLLDCPGDGKTETEKK